MIFASTFLIFLTLSIIQFSFSVIFSDNIWFMLGLLKGVTIFVDYILERTINEMLLVSPLSITMVVVLGLVTFGADDFLDFLNAFFIELGI